MNNKSKTVTDIDNLLKTEFDIEKIESIWNDRSRFFCTLRKAKDGNIIIANASAAYFKVIGIDCNCCGKDIYGLYPHRLADFISHTLFGKEKEGRIFKYVRESAVSDDIWLVTAVSANDEAKFAGKLLTDHSIFYNGGQNPSECRENINADFIGTIIAAAENDDFLVKFCSEQIYSEFPALSENASLKNAAEKHLLVNPSLKLLWQSIHRNIPVTYYDLSHTECNCLPKVYRLSVMPAVSAKCKAVSITVHLAKNTKRNNASEDICSPFCEICRTPSGKVYIRDMNSAFYELFKRGEIPYSDICSESLFKESERLGCGEIKSAICGKNGLIYSLKLLPRFTDSVMESLIVIVSVISSVGSLSKLTSREKETLSLAANSYPNRFIAHALGVSEGTVKKLIHNGYTKLGITSRVELVRLYGGLFEKE